MTDPFASPPPPGHRWSRWVYSWPRRRWFRHCGITTCTAVESVPRGMKPKKGAK